jgi:AcrR family transcriptional regulator
MKISADPDASTQTPASKPKPRRRPGRPAGSVSKRSQDTKPLISREAIIEKATQLAKTEPLNELSIVGLAKEFGVTTALIHYYAGSRDDLISGVVNRYFQARIERFEPIQGNWRTNIEKHARAIFDVSIEFGGVLQYLMSHNKFRLFQQVSAGEVDYGMVYLNRLAEIFRAGGFSAEQTAMGYHLLVQYLMTAAYAEVNRQLPSNHGKYLLARINETSAEQYPGAHFMAGPFSKLDSEKAFEAGLALILDGFEHWKKPDLT